MFILVKNEWNSDVLINISSIATVVPGTDGDIKSVIILSNERCSKIYSNNTPKEIYELIKEAVK